MKKPKPTPMGVLMREEELKMMEAAKAAIAAERAAWARVLAILNGSKK